VRREEPARAGVNENLSRSQPCLKQVGPQVLSPNVRSGRGIQAVADDRGQRCGAGEDVEGLVTVGDLPAERAEELNH